MNKEIDCDNCLNCLNTEDGKICNYDLYYTTSDIEDDLGYNCYGIGNTIEHEVSQLTFQFYVYENWYEEIIDMITRHQAVLPFEIGYYET